MKYIDNNISFSDMMKYVDVVVSGSVGMSGKYHKYLQDYAETLTLLALFTDYKNENTDESELFNEVMEICHSNEWKNEILPQIKRYELFDYYVNEEIKYNTRPMAELSETMASIQELIKSITELTSSVDIEKLKDINIEDVIKKANDVMSITNTSGEMGNLELDGENND